MTQQVKVSDGIEDLVLDELIFVAKAIVIKDSVIVDHDSVIKVAAQREVVLSKCL